MKAEVVTVSSYDPKPSYYRPNAFKASLEKFGVTPTILGHNEEWWGLMTKPYRYREFISNEQYRGDVLLLVDAWDVLFAAHPDEIVELAKVHWPPDTVVFNAERNCFPCPEMTHEFNLIASKELEINSPWKYLNSGFMLGTPAALLALLDSINLEVIGRDRQNPDQSWNNPNDQEHFQKAFLKSTQRVRMALDYRTRLCMAAHGSTLEELDFTGERIKNKITGTTPLVFHCNGSAKNDLAPAILEHLGLPQK